MEAIQVRTFMVSIILPYTFTGRHFPKPSRMVRRCYLKFSCINGVQTGRRTSDQIRGIGTECAIPNPALVTNENFLLLELIVLGYGPHFDSGVCRACSKVPARVLINIITKSEGFVTLHPG